MADMDEFSGENPRTNANTSVTDGN